jgi:hypothetical protein
MAKEAHQDHGVCLFAIVSRLDEVAHVMFDFATMQRGKTSSKQCDGGLGFSSSCAEGSNVDKSHKWPKMSKLGSSP